MQEVNFSEALEIILQRDPRFHRDAYMFVREAIDFTQKMVARTNKDEVRHVSGQELLAGIREYLLQQYGPMSFLMLEEWGVHRCEDFGDIVFNMVEANLLAKTDKDSREDFKGGYDFNQAFNEPFRPTTRAIKPDSEPKTSQP